ncbi:lipoprotein NlpI [Succinivibrio dextrinosolvens]|uniref:hypothetical protein n=1 Tax=Succinivibrio dextrinosolvens TaxID=83771 RepID=UPI0008E20D42|nr:hypothetical protein [Succinivibrio dextrinosolvens]SFS81850.1 lipoprotein NlpI [Succinivibrio dextrinosolvens]
MFKFIKPRALIEAVGLLSILTICGCSSSFKSSDINMLEEPMSVPSKFIFFPNPSQEQLAKEQNAITSLMVSLDSQAKTSKEKAELFYNLGAIYDDLGMETLARFMYMNSVVQNPNYYRPYEVLGPYFYRDGKVGDAVDSLDAALNLNKEKDDPYIYLHRGIIMYYTGHYKYAVEDMMEFYKSEPDDPYKMLCLYFAAEKHYGKEYADSLLQSFYNDSYTLKSKALENWGFNFIKLFLNKTSEDEIFADIIKIKDNEDLFQEHLCEAYYYIGQYKQLQGKDKLAYDYFKLCQAAKKYGFLEHRLAIYEAQQLEKKYKLKRAVSVDQLTD